MAGRRHVGGGLVALLTLAAACGEEASPTVVSAGGTSGTSGIGGTAGGGAGGAESGGTAPGGSGGAAAGTAGAAAGTAGAAAGTAGSGVGGAGAGAAGAGAAGTGGKGMVVPPLPCFVDAGEPAGSAIDLALTPSRISGVAPLAVYFETQGTTADATMRPFHELAYCWDFGDTESGSFSTTGLSKNQARGPAAGHVFETPGSYSVTVSARDAMGRVASRGVTVSVDDPDEVFAADATVCLSATGDFADCPAGAQQITAATLGTLNSKVAPGRRLLLHRGEEYTGALSINSLGPGMVGAYGSATARPRVLADAETFFISDQDPNFADWRIVDIDVEGQTTDAEVVYVGGKATNLLVLRTRGASVGLGIGAGDSIIDYWNANGHPGHDVIDGLAIADCEMRDLVGGSGHNLSYIAGHRLLMLGNVYANSLNGEHVLRTTWVDRGVISDNDLSEANTPRHLLKMHAPKFDGPGIGAGKATEQVVISDNIFHSTGGHDWSVAIGPQNEASNEHVRDVVFERNLFLPGPEAQVALIIWGQSITVRDNLFNRGPQSACISVGTRGIEPSPTEIAIFHNTCYSEAARPSLVDLDGSATMLTLFNNLVAGPTATGRGYSGTFDSEGGNLVSTDPSFAATPPTSAADFALEAGSPAIDTADPTHMTAWDFSGRPRPIDGDDSGSAEPDVGALERAP